MWIIRFGGWSLAPSVNTNESLVETDTNLIAWYNNQGHHALPAYLNSLHNAIYRMNFETEAERRGVGITTYVHPMKVTTGQINSQDMWANFKVILLLINCQQFWVFCCSLPPSRMDFFKINVNLWPPVSTTCCLQYIWPKMKILVIISFWKTKCFCSNKWASQQYCTIPNFILKMSSLKLGSYEWTSNAYLTHNLLWLIQGNTTSKMAETNITNESAKDCFCLLSFITITHFYGI